MTGALVLFAIALVVRLGWAAAMGLDGLYGQDAYYILEEGEALWRTGRHLGTDAIGAPAVIAAALAAGGGRIAVVQMALAVLGAAAVVAVAWLARALGLPRRAAWVSGALMALAPEHVAQSILVMTDGPAVFWLVLGVLGAVLAARDPTRPWVVLAALGLAAAVATRYVTALVALPLLCYLGSCVMGHRSSVRAGLVAEPAGDARHMGRRVVWLVLAAAVGGGILWLEWRHSRIGVPSGHMLREWSLANALRREFDDVRGHVTLAHPVGLGYLRALGSWGFLCPLLIPVAGLGAWRLRRDPAGWFLAAWAGLFLLFLCGLQVVSRRYLLPALPPLAILAAVGLVSAVDAVSQGATTRKGMTTDDRRPVIDDGAAESAARRATNVARDRWSVVGGRSSVTLLLFLAMSAGTYSNLGPLAERKRCELEAVRWVEENTPAGSRVAAVDLGLALQRYGRRPVLTLHESDPAAWRLPAGDEPGLYVVWDEAFILRHMAKRPRPEDPAAALGPHARWLRTYARLTPLARVCRWSVLRVNARDRAGLSTTDG